MKKIPHVSIQKPTECLSDIELLARAMESLLPSNHPLKEEICKIGKGRKINKITFDPDKYADILKPSKEGE